MDIWRFAPQITTPNEMGQLQQFQCHLTS
jgi:hypothetical protein